MGSSLQEPECGQRCAISMPDWPASALDGHLLLNPAFMIATSQIRKPRVADRDKSPTHSMLRTASRLVPNNLQRLRHLVAIRRSTPVSNRPSLPKVLSLGAENTLRVQTFMTCSCVLMKTTDPFDFSKISM